MNYNFDKEIPRRGTNCVKWDEAEEGVLPMWVADMDFETAPCVKEAVRHCNRKRSLRRKTTKK